MKPVDGVPGTEARLRSLLALLQMASPALPVGAFAYSQGLEKAVEDGLVFDLTSAQRWIEDLLTLSLARFEAPLWLRAFEAATAGDDAAFARWNEELIAARETAELRAETLQMGASLLRVFPALELTPPTGDAIAFPMAFATACSGLGIDRETGLAAYLWAWLEGQTMAAIKCLPLGQQAGQTLLFALHGAVTRAVSSAASLDDDELGSAPVQYALVSARHETQYSRLFRS